MVISWLSGRGGRKTEVVFMAQYSCGTSHIVINRTSHYFDLMVISWLSYRRWLLRFISRETLDSLQHSSHTGPKNCLAWCTIHHAAVLWERDYSIYRFEAPEMPAARFASTIYQGYITDIQSLSTTNPESVPFWRRCNL